MEATVMDCLYQVSLKQGSVSSVFVLRFHNEKETTVGTGGNDTKELRHKNSEEVKAGFIFTGVR